MQSPLSLPLSISIPLFSFIIIFSIENSDHKLPGLVSLLFLNRKYANIFFSLISTSCSFNHIHNEAYANSYLCKIHHIQVSTPLLFHHHCTDRLKLSP
ncbi:hypothetical protein C0J52_26720 [Blattella germanica]|nr:hypothetical protein C0J52_26720 [Blattella germanica]